MIIAAMTLSCLNGSWVNACVNNCHISLALDTFCFDNIIAYDIATAIGCDIIPHDEMVRGVGGAGVMLSGITNVKISIGGVAKLVEFKVSQGIEGFAFMGLKEMKKWDMVIRWRLSPF